MPLNAQDSYKAAIEIVRAGLSSESIKLHGCSSNTSPTTSKSNGEMDAAYHDALIKGLVKTLGE